MPTLAGLMSTQDAFGHAADLFNDIKRVGWGSTPFFSSLSAKAPTAKTKSFFGHEWLYEEIPDGDANNAHIEGDAPAPLSVESMGSLKNHYQIFKDSYGVSGSEDEAERVDGTKELMQQFALKSIKHRKSIEMALLGSQAPVQRVNTGVKVAGRLGGIKHFLSAANDFNAAGANLTYPILREILKPGFMHDLPVKVLMMNDTQKDALDDILWSKTMVNAFNPQTIENNITLIKQTAYGNDIKVIFSPFLAADEIIAYNPEYINPVVYRPTRKKPIPDGDDAMKEQIITELTLRVSHPFAVCRLKGLAV